jgi:long-chain acyl-CoA synthetase
MNSASNRTLLTSYLDDFASRGNEIAFAHYEGLRVKRWSYLDIAQTASQVARELEARGIGKGDRVLLWARNSPEWVATFFGCLLRGVVVVPIDVQSEHGFVHRVQDQVTAKLVFADHPTNSIESEIPAINLSELRGLLADHSSARYPTSNASTEDLVEIVFTSGTTAEPKGVSLTHRNVLANLNPLEEETRKYLKWEPLVHPIRFLNLVPLSHVFGQLMGILVPPLVRGTVYFQESLLPSRVIETVKRERISVIVCVPRILETLREKIEREYEGRNLLDQFHRNLAHAKESHFLQNWWTFRRVHKAFGWKFWAFISGGAALNSEIEDFWQRLGFAVIQGYGMTETAAIISVNHPFKKTRGSIGKVMRGQELRLDEHGEILVRGENVSRGYWNAGARSDNVEWFRTGDAGEMDQAGNLYFKGRTKEVIVTSAGMNVYPEDIEDALNRQPGVKMSVVVEIAGTRGPEPLAVLILRDDRASASEVVESANKLLQQHQQVRRWSIWPDEDFPRTATLKIRKALVAQQIQEGLSASAVAGPSGTLEKVVAQVAGEVPERLDSSAKLGTDLKLDSLGRVELLSALEDRYHVDFDEAAFTEATTLGDVERIIRVGQEEQAVSYPYPRWQQRWPFSGLRVVLFYLVVWPFTRVMARPVVRDKRNLESLDGPLVFICNHVTLADQALVMFALPGRIRRRLAIAMDGELLREMRHPPSSINPFKRLVWKLEYFLVVLFFNVFSMPQKSGFRHSFAFAGELMDQGFSILIFPEGTRTKDGEMKPFRVGTGLLISKLNTSVVPISLDGLWKLKEAGRYFAKAGEVFVTIGKPRSFSSRAEPNQIVLELEEAVRKLV